MADETTRRSAVAEYAEAQEVVAEARAGRGGRADVVKGTLSYLALLALWELVMPRLYPELSLPRFVPAALAYYGTAEFWASLAVSFRRVAVGYLTAAALAIPLGIFLGYVPRLHRFFDPLLALIRPISPLAWLPLALVWFGISEGAAIFLIAYTAFFPIFLNTLHGVLEAPLQFKEAALTLGARKDQIAVHVTLPGAFTSVLTGLRLGIGVSWGVIVAAELAIGFVLQSGVGYLLHSYTFLSFDLTRLVTITAAIGVIGFGLDSLQRRLADRITPWRAGLKMAG